MRIASYRRRDHSSFGLVKDGGLVDLGSRMGCTDLKDALERLHEAHAFEGAQPDVALSDVELLPVIPNPAKIFCVGVNYRTHLAETGRPVTEQPMIFTRFANSQIGHLAPIVRPRASEQLDFEGELAVVIGRRGRHVEAASAHTLVAGYSCYNDGTLRDWQRHTSQFIPGKNFVGTGAFGPWLVTPDEFGPVESATLVTRLNGSEMQRARLDDLIFGVADLIAYCSTFTELEPGDVIVTGTTGGVGAYRTPPVWMKPGDTVEVEIAGIGTLRNPVVAEA